MKRPISFCKTWFRARKRPTEVWTREQALAAHVAHKLYCVVVESPDKPFCFLEINDRFVGVGFLDARLRETLYYAFREVEPGRLFLTTATHRSFVGATEVVAEGSTYVFSRDGTVKIQKQHVNPHSASTAVSTTDVSANYAAWPAFGEYDDLIRVERQG